MSENHKLRDKSPFKGPRAFTEDDKEWFFGRDYETDEILSLILGHKLVLIYGRSGSGKTSLLNASIIPKLKENRFRVFPIADVGYSSFLDKSLKPSNPYIFNALQSITYADDSIHKQLSTNNLLPSAETTLSEYLTNIINVEKRQDGVKKKPLVIIFDQLEQLFTNIYSEKWREQHQDFFKQISDALDSDDFLLRVLFVIRDDYLNILLPFGRRLPENFRPRFQLERLSKDQAKEAIEKPLEKAKVKFKELEIDEKRIDNLLKLTVETSNGQSNRQSISMIENIVNNLSSMRLVLPNEEPKDVIGDFVEPIQLQIVCEKLWSNIMSAQGSTITQKDLKDLGDVDKSLKDLYEKSIHDVIKNSANHVRDVKGLALLKQAYHLKSYIKKSRISEDRIREWFDKKLITEEDTRNSVHQGRKSTEGVPNNIIEALERKHLLKSQIFPSGIIYKLTHDRLIKPIRKSNQERRLIIARNKSRILGLILIISISAFIIGIAMPMFRNDPCAKRLDIILREGAALPDDTAINEYTNMIYITTHPFSPNDPSIKAVDCTKYDKFEESIQEKGASKLAIDPKTNLIYVANTGTNTVSVIQDDASIAPPFYNKILVFLKGLGLPITTNLHNLKNIRVGNQPDAIAVNSKTNKIYVTNTGSNTVSVIDGGDIANPPHILKNITVGNQPNGLAIDPYANKVYVANTGNNTVSVVDGNKMDVIENISVGKAPFAISIDKNTKKMYVVNRDNDTLSIIDGGSGSKIYNVSNTVSVGKGPIDIAVDDDENHNIYVINNRSKTVSIIDGKTNNVKGTIPLEFSPKSISIDHQSNMLYINSLDLTAGGILEVRNNTVSDYPKYVQVGNDPRHIAVNPTTNKVYVANTGSNTVSVIGGGGDITNPPHIIKNIRVGNQPDAIAVNPTTNKVYVANTGSNTVSMIDGKTNNVTSVIKVTGKQPLGIAVNPKTNKVYVANTGNNTVSVIKDDGSNTNKNIVIKNVLVGKNLTSIAVNPTTNKIYVTNTGSNTVSVIDGTTDRITSNVTLPFYIDQYNTVAVNPKTNKIYVIGLVRGQFSIINSTTDKIIPSKNQQAEDVMSALGGGPTTLAFNPYHDEIYSANRYLDTVSLTNGSKFPSILAVAKVHSSPYDIAFNESNKLIYVVNKDSNTIAIIKPAVTR